MKHKPKYNILQNVEWMIGIAWKIRKRAIVFCLITAILEVLYHLIQLYIAPKILSCVEQGVSLEYLILTIVVFTLILFIIVGLKTYIEQCSSFPRIDVRLHIVSLISRKNNMTSYSHIFDEDFIKLREKAYKTTNNNKEATEHIWITITNLLKNLGGFIVFLGVLSHLDIIMLLLVIVTCVINFCVAKYVNDWYYQHQDEEDQIHTKSRYIRDKAESVVLAKDVRIFGLQDWINEISMNIYNMYRDFRARYEKKLLLSEGIEVLLTIARNTIAYVYLIRLTLLNGLSVSQFLLYFTAISTLTTWVMGILQEFVHLHKESLDISTVREYLDYPELFQFEEGKKIPFSDNYELKLENVSFRYPGAQKDTIHHMNLTIHAGENLAIVGLNGAGKTTLVKLLCGLFDPNEGSVLLNGKDIRQYNRREYYALFSSVFQEFSVLDVTVAENIAQSHQNIDLKKVYNCIEKAGLSKTIAQLPKGIQTHIGREVYLDGVLFSGGQTQRLMLARALYKNAPILLLDEPTAALDPIAENDIYMKYNEMTKGKTSLFISHRLASTRFCDRIIFLVDGHIEEEGTHESLLALNKQYAKLFEIQSRYYQEGRSF